MKFLLFYFFALLTVAGSAQSYTAIESVEFDPGSGHFFVSNGTTIIDRAPNGDLSYFGNAEANYGMEVMNNVLFAIKGGGVRAYDLNNGQQLASLEIIGASFLNGMANDGVSRIWVTDFGANKIYECDFSNMASPSYLQVVSDTGTIPNGIVYDDQNDRLIFVSWGSNAPIKEVSLSNYMVSTITSTSLGNCDGIDKDGQNNYFISSWNPTRITKYNEDFSTDEIITAPGLSAPADISYGVEIDSLAIPNSGNQTVTFVGFGDTWIDDEDADSPQMTVFPNPVTQESVIEFQASTSQFTTLEVVNMEGKIVEVLLSEQLAAGHHRVLMRGIHLQKGYYIYRLTKGDNVLHFPFLVE